MSKKGSIQIEVKSLSHKSLVKIIEQLKDSAHRELLQKARCELVARLRQKGFGNGKIASILIANVYGKLKKRSIAKDWAGSLGLTVEEFLELIGMR